jgi:hypothetical protein
VYWIWANERSDDAEARISGTPEVVEREDLAFDRGVRLTRAVPLVEIVRDEDSQGVLTDNLIAPGTNGLVMSKRLRDTLARAGVTNIDYYPCRITNPADGSVTDDYQIANVIGQIACVDREASDLEMHPKRPDEIEFINSLVLDESAIAGPLMFRLAEFRQLIVVHDQVKDACTAAGITGIKFYRPEEFSL